MVTVTSSPTLNDLAVMPKLISVDGLFHSPIHCTTLPFSSLASNFRNEWGYVQCHSVTTPSIVTVFLSYEAFPCCAYVGRINNIKRTKDAPIETPTLLFIPNLQVCF